MTIIAESWPLPASTSPTEPTRCRTATVFDFPERPSTKQRYPEVQAPTQACDSDAPDLTARVYKQLERRVADMPGVVLITNPKTRNAAWHLRFIDPSTGKWTAKRLGAVGQMAFMDMAALAKSWQVAIAEGRSPNAASMTVDAFVKKVFEPWAIANKASHRDDFSRYALYLRDAIGAKSLGAVRRSDLERLIISLCQGTPAMRRGKLSNASINRIVMVALVIFRLAVNLGYISSNPLKGLRLLKESPPSPRALDSEEVERLGPALVGFDRQFQLLIHLLSATATRINEALNLQVTGTAFWRCCTCARPRPARPKRCR